MIRGDQMRFGGGGGATVRPESVEGVVGWSVAAEGADEGGAAGKWGT